MSKSSAVLVVATGVVLFLTSLGLYLFARDSYSESQIRRMIGAAYNQQRPGGGRLFGAAYSSLVNASKNSPDLGRAQLLLLTHGDTASREHLQGLIHLASGDWKRFAASFATPHLPNKDAATLNNLGASYLALSEADPIYLLKALDCFERAANIDPTAAEPRFNLVITYRKMSLPDDVVIRNYESIDSRSPWYLELRNEVDLTESVFVDELRRAVEGGSHSQAERLFENNVALSRRVAMLYGVSNVPESTALVRFIANQIERRFGDKTVSAMIEPLFTEKREITIAIRDSVTQGAQLHAQGNFQGSAETYAKAKKLLDESPSVFDRLWIDLNSVDTEIRLGQFEIARRSLERLVSVSRQNGFIWLTARALAIYGSTVRLTSSYAEMMRLVEEADRTLVTIDAQTDRLRPLFYLSYYRYGAGDHDEAFRLAIHCRRLTDQTDHNRISSLMWLLGSILYRKGLPETAALFAEESVRESQLTANQGGVATTASTLAQLYQSMSKDELAQKYLGLADRAFGNMGPGFDRTRIELLLGVATATRDFNRRQYSEAESLLKKNLDIYSLQPFQAPGLLSSSLMLLARTYAATGRLGLAAEKFDEAIEVIEGSDEYLQSEKLRVTFDDSRRDLYDFAITFEYDNGSPEVAWRYLQKYRAKLFLEFLGQFNPKIKETRSGIERSRVQQLLPADIQVIEYFLLKDRILIWLITDKLFTLRVVQQSRAEVEEKIQNALQKLRTGDDVELPLTDLGKVLIEPVEHLLDRGRTIAIVPDRALHGLPFGALRRPGKKNYLIQDYSVAVTPSLTHLLATDTAKHERNMIVGFGSQNGAATEIQELNALRNIYEKASTVAGQKVNKAGFLKSLGSAPVFHYSGHSVTDAVDPLRSSILLDGNRYGPNTVTAVDISQQRLLKNAVVILSSCDSSVGNSRDGVGVRGLTSAFLIGGAGSVVGSLWPVEASSTAELMINFHRSFATSQMPVAKALRQAQLQFLEAFPDRSHPYYWSGFVVTGNLSALK